MLEDIEHWLHSKKPIELNGIQCFAKEHPIYRGKPLCVQKGQAVALFLYTQHSQEFILKKFLQGKTPDTSYLQNISTVLPQHPSFAAGIERVALSSSDLKKTRGCHYKPSLASWISNTILMPRIQGSGWNVVADAIRDKSIVLTAEQRLMLCRHLIELVQLLKKHGCAHRDLSCGNVFIDTATCEISLIDFDSLYHPKLAMPSTTTCGSEGYTAPFVWEHNTPNTLTTWCDMADTFALSVLIVEFLLLDHHAPLAGDGGMFEQEDLRNRSGRTIDIARRKLQATYPSALPLFETVIHSKCYQDCPSPEKWMQWCDSIACQLKPLPLNSFEDIDFSRLQSILQNSRRKTWTPPGLDEFPAVQPLSLNTAVLGVRLRQEAKTSACS